MVIWSVVFVCAQEAERRQHGAESGNTAQSQHWYVIVVNQRLPVTLASAVMNELWLHIVVALYVSFTTCRGGCNIFMLTHLLTSYGKQSTNHSPHNTAVFLAQLLEYAAGIDVFKNSYALSNWALICAEFPLTKLHRAHCIHVEQLQRKSKNQLPIEHTACIMKSSKEIAKTS